VLICVIFRFSFFSDFIIILILVFTMLTTTAMSVEGRQMNRNIPGAAGQHLSLIRVQVDEVDEAVRHEDAIQIHFLPGHQTLAVLDVVFAYLFDGRRAVQTESFSLLHPRLGFVRFFALRVR